MSAKEFFILLVLFLLAFGYRVLEVLATTSAKVVA